MSSESDIFVITLCGVEEAAAKLASTAFPPPLAAAAAMEEFEFFFLALFELAALLPGRVGCCGTTKFAFLLLSETGAPHILIQISHNWSFHPSELLLKWALNGLIQRGHLI